MNRYLLKAERAMTNLRRADTRRDPRRAQYWKRQTIRYCILGLKSTGSELRISWTAWKINHHKPRAPIAIINTWEQINP